MSTDRAAIRAALDTADRSDDFGALCLDYLDGRLAAAAAASLVSQLEADPAKRQAFVLTCYRGQLVAEAMGARSVPLSPRERAGVRADHPVRTPRPVARFPFRVPRSVYALAAALLLAAAGVAIYLAVASGGAPPKPADPAAGTFIATLIDSTGGGTVMYESDIARSGVEYGSGQYSLDAGSAQFMLASRVTVDLRGRTLLVMRDAMHATLEHGSAGFRCPPEAKGFTVRLPDGSNIVDLGTAFKVDIDDASPTRIAVTEGRVAISSPGRDPLHVDAGQSALVRHDAAGAVVSVDLLDRPDAAIDDLIADPSLIAWHDFEADGDAEGYFSGSRSRAFNADSEGVPVAAGGPYEAMTMAMWVYLDESTSAAGLLMSDGWGEDGAVHWQLDRGRPMLITYRGPGVRVTESISLKRWTHLAVVIDPASESAIYIDGRLAAAQPAAPAAHDDRRPIRPGDMQIGVWKRLAFAPQQSPRVLLGRADDAGLWRRALTADQIARLAARPDPLRSDNRVVPESHDAADRERIPENRERKTKGAP